MRTVARVIAELLVTFGLVLALLVAHLKWGTDDYTRRAQRGLSDELDKVWSAQSVVAVKPGRAHAVTPPAPAPAKGRPFAVLRVPRFGASWHFTAVEGVTDADLAKGPGHYPGTAQPGQVGNAVFSGHRTTYLAPFNRMGELVPGDEILVDTATLTHVYRVTGHRIVLPTDLSVLAPVPGRPGERARRASLTLTTCHPKYSAAYRLVVFAELSASRPRTT
ncbi:class E sortase [Actinocorallia longicatena]|uniref:Class E sortase n=1 Tax=Actinocorallia longicatena TaxID=111803 RepID=A0ABP6Q3U8_9ACTN